MIRIDQKVDLAKLLVAEGASYDSHADEHLSRCLADTRTELQQQITEWAKDAKAKPIFWLSGMAGTGKSTIARTIAQSFADSSQLGASFFFKRGEGDRGNASRFFTTIAKDLAASIPNLIAGVQKAIDSNQDISQKNLRDQFEKLIFEPLVQTGQILPRATKFVIVIDALDECEREQDIHVILHLLARIKNAGSISLRIFVTSRPELPIRLGFKKLSDGTYQDLILEEVKRGSIKHDLTRFVEHEFKEISEQRSLSPDWHTSDQLHALVQMAIPLFIFAATICRYIKEPGDSPRERLEIVLSYQKRNITQLEMTYLPILENLLKNKDEQDRKKWGRKFQDIVGSIIVLESPLPIASLSRLLDVRKDDLRCFLDSLHSVLSIRDDEKFPIRPLHLSFRDFLVDPKKRGDSPFWVDEREVHKMLIGRCLQLLSTALKQDICDLKKPGILVSEICSSTIHSKLPLEVQYASRYWFHHLEQSQSRVESRDAYKFLHEHVLHWFEAMSLIGEISKAVRIVDMFQSYVKVKVSLRLQNYNTNGSIFIGGR
jgi:hypothetical protein